MNWSYQGKDFTEIPEDTYGFIYCITYTNGQKYIGQKQFYSKITLAALQSGEQRPNSKRVYKRKKLNEEELANRSKTQIRTNVQYKSAPYDICSKPMKWQSYEGSSKREEKLEIAFKEILHLAESKRMLTYLECKALFSSGAIESDDYINDNILNKFHRDNLK